MIDSQRTQSAARTAKLNGQRETPRVWLGQKVDLPLFSLRVGQISADQGRKGVRGLRPRQWLYNGLGR